MPPDMENYQVDSDTSDENSEQPDNEGRSLALPKTMPPLKSVPVEMCHYCFDVVGAMLFPERIAKPASPMFPSEPFPAFVTWEVGQKRSLRGCVGDFTTHGVPLQKLLSHLAISSASKDHRFKPISREEFSQLHVTVSLLIDFETCSNYSDWQVGVHGIRIYFTDEFNVERGATFLPNVIADKQWNHRQTMENLMIKAGYKGAVSEEMLRKVEVTRYRSMVNSASYADYIQAKNGTA